MKLELVIILDLKTYNVCTPAEHFSAKALTVRVQVTYRDR